jgi:hypothetical protein
MTTKQNTRQPQGAAATAPQIAGYSRTVMTTERGLAYTLDESGRGADAAWLTERAARLVALLVPFDGMVETNSDHTGAALAEIIEMVANTRDETERENVTTALIDFIFARTNTHDHTVGEFSRRRLVLPPAADLLVDAAVAVPTPRRPSAPPVEPRGDEPQPDYARAAARVSEILADATSPQFLVDVLSDMIIDLENETDVNSLDPDAARTILLKAFPVAEAINLRQRNGTLLRDGAAAATVTPE